MVGGAAKRDPTCELSTTNGGKERDDISRLQGMSFDVDHLLISNSNDDNRSQAIILDHELCECILMGGCEHGIVSCCCSISLHRTCVVHW